MNTLLPLKLATLCGLLCAGTAHAGFATYSTNWPNGPETVNENAVDEATAAMLPDEKKEIVCIDDTYGTETRMSEKGRLYFKLGANYLTASINQLRNISSGPFAGRSLTTPNYSKSFTSWETALGTTWSFLRVELEYVHTKQLTYNAVPVTVGRNENLSSTIDNTSVLLDFYYDFDAFAYFKPYVGAAWGISWNSTRTTLYGGALGNNIAQNSNYVSIIAWGIMFGGRIPFSERWNAYVQYRYNNLGRLTFASNTANLQMQGQYVLQGVSLGVMYTF